ncbi:MAG: hypothetical protein H7A25_03955 [Leptospiraceae bacterium]|nr:hypothetical protein [Leptospiraceae bacterium]MCP5499029.1 hypothetical protein [Leptospiraceae bacterium]
MSEKEESTIPGFNPKLVLLDKENILRKNQTRTIELIFKVSNHHNGYGGGIWHPIQVGDYHTLSNRIQRTAIIDFFLLGSILIMGLYHFGLYFLRKKDPSTLWFGIYCILISIRILLTGEKYLERLVPNSYKPLTFLEYISLVLLVPVFVNFIYYIFPEEYTNRVRKGFVWVGYLFTLPILLLSSFYYTKTTTSIQVYILITSFFTIYGLVKATLNRRQGAKTFLGGFLFFFVIIIHDILHAQLIIESIPLFAPGLFGFIFSQAAVLSMRFSSAFNISENLSNDLEKLNSSLEQKVAERTLQLEIQSREIEDNYNVQKVLNSILEISLQNISLNEQMDKILKIILSLEWIAADKGSIFLKDKNSEHLIMISNFGLHEHLLSACAYLPLGFCFCGKAASEKRIIYRNQLDEDHNVTYPEIEPHGHYCIPILYHHNLLGVLNLYVNEGHIRIQKEEKVLSSIVNVMAGIIQQKWAEEELKDAQLIAEKAKEKALIAQKETTFLNEFAKTINSSHILEETFTMAVTELFKKIGADLFILQLVNPDKNEFFVRCSAGYLTQEQNLFLTMTIYPIKPEAGTPYLTFSQKRTTYLRHAGLLMKNSSSRFDTFFIEKLKLTTIFQIPLIVQEDVKGIMHINKFGGLNKLSKDEIHFCESLCEQLAIAVNNSHLYELTEKERQKSENLLLNILPEDVAKELKEKGSYEPVLFESVSVMFTDFKGFTQIAEKLTPQELVKDLDTCFVQFDKISEKYNLEKLKTIGDSYMCAGGIPRKNKTHAIDCILAALEIQDFMNMMKSLKEEMGFPYWELRLGIHSGPLVAGVIGERKFAYDVWGDTVNTASRMESSGTPGKINISGATYGLVKVFFDCEYRGDVAAKNKGMVQMYYVDGLKPEFSKDKEGRVPNGRFWEMYGIP